MSCGTKGWIVRNLSLRVLDDVAASDAARAEPSLSRTRLLQHAFVGGGAVVAGGVLIGGLPGLAPAAPSVEQDVRILNLVLLLEELKAAFYTDAEARAELRGELAEFARIVGEHERAHVAYLRKALGDRAERKPSFDFGNATVDRESFAATAAMLEDTSVAAYNGQAANLTKPVLKAAATIVSVEARHAAWIRDMLGQRAAPDATDEPATASQVERAVARTGFVKGPR
jgi:rubrerythrin